jgi:hypothetical protein
MKYIAFIVLGLVLVAAIGGIVLWAIMPTTRLSVHAVRPMGTNFIYCTRLGGKERWPLWEFAITNAGRAPASWKAFIRFKDEDHEGAEFTAGNLGPVTSLLFVTNGLLSAGQSETINVGVPPDSNTNWVIAVEYWAVKTAVEKTLDRGLRPVQTLRSLLPNANDHVAASGWYSGTNVTTAH